jgi:hypothetical protein
LVLILVMIYLVTMIYLSLVRMMLILVMIYLV